MRNLPDTFEGIGYTRSRNGFPLESVQVPVPRPGPGQVLIHAAYSSLNPLEYKLADLNFFGRTPPVILGFDLAGTVVALGEGVAGLAVGDEVAAMADCNQDGAWATGGHGGYALVRDFCTVKKPGGLAMSQAAALPLCFLSAYLGICEHLQPGETVYIPGGGGGVGHLALQLASRVVKAKTIISSGSTAASIELARASGATHVYRLQAGRCRCAGGRAHRRSWRQPGLRRHLQRAELRQHLPDGSRRRTLGRAGRRPGKTSRTDETKSPVAEILSTRHAELINVNLLRYFSDPAFLDAAAQALFHTALTRAMAWAAEGKVVPHVERVIESSVESINASLGAMRAGRSPVGKVVVQLDVGARR